jgi:peptidoglycan-associated lipoprotein
MIFTGCETISPPLPEDTLAVERGEDTAYYRFHRAGEDYVQKDLLAQVLFDFDRSNVLPDDRKMLQTVATELKANPSREVRIIGFCDWYGKEGYNLELGRRRAAAVAKILEENGVEGGRMQCESRGSQDSPIGLSKGDASFDRRVDIIPLLRP